MPASAKAVGMGRILPPRTAAGSECPVDLRTSVSWTRGAAAYVRATRALARECVDDSSRDERVGSDLARGADVPLSITLVASTSPMSPRFLRGDGNPKVRAMRY